MSSLAVSSAVCAQSSSNPDPDFAWMSALRRMAETGEEPDEALRGLAAESGNRTSVAGRVSRLTESPLDRLILAALYFEGQDLGLRRMLREKNCLIFQTGAHENRTIWTLSAEGMVAWLGGESEAWRAQIAQRLLPQGALTSRRLISRGDAATPLEGGVRLTPFLASLLYPGDGSDARKLDENLSIDRPRKRLTDLVLAPAVLKELESFIKLCRQADAPNRCAVLWGRAGTGKTVSAEAIAGELGIPFLSARPGREESDALFFERAAAAARIEGAVLFLDECGRWMEAEGMRRGPNSGSAALLQILQDHPGVVIGAMNQDWCRLHEAFQRRFQVQIGFKMPDTQQRVELWKRNLRTPAAPGAVEAAARRYELTGGLIRNAAARADSRGMQTIDAAGIDAEARAQVNLDLDWQDVPYFNNIDAARRCIDRKSRRELVALGLKLKMLAGLPDAAGSVRFDLKVALEFNGMDAGMNAAVLVSKVAGLDMRWESLHSLTFEKREQGRPSRVEYLDVNLSRAWRAGVLPVLACDATELEPGGKSSALMEFLHYTGTGLLLIEGDNRPPLPRVSGTIRLETRQFDFVRWGRDVFAPLEPWVLADGVKELLRDLCSGDSYRAGVVLREAIFIACLRRKAESDAATVTCQDAERAAEFHLRGLKPNVKLLF